MTYVVTQACIKCKYMDCVEVCPVDCFYEGESMLVINPDECIDCGVCEPECPIEAILPDTEDEAERWLELNREYSTGPWPNITRKGEAACRRRRLQGRARQVRKVLQRRRPARAVDRSARVGFLPRRLLGHAMARRERDGAVFCSPNVVSVFKVNCH